VLRAQSFYHLGRYPRHQGFGRNHSFFGNHGARRHYDPVPYAGLVKDFGSHPYEHMVFNGAGVDNGTVAHYYLIADNGGGLPSYVNHAVVLNTCPRSNGYFVHVSANYGIGPNTALFAENNVPNYGGVRSNVTARMNIRLLAI